REVRASPPLIGVHAVLDWAMPAGRAQLQGTIQSHGWPTGGPQPIARGSQPVNQRANLNGRRGEAALMHVVHGNHGDLLGSNVGTITYLSRAAARSAAATQGPHPRRSAGCER